MTGLLAHGESQAGWGTWIEPWEFHPMLVHFPIALLLGGVAVGAYARLRGAPNLIPAARGMLIAGVLTGLAAGAAGALAFYTVPAHTEEAHRLMYWHLGLQLAALLLFAWLAWSAGREPRTASALNWVLAAVATAVLIVGSGIGGYIVYHGAAGVEPSLLSHEVREVHEH